MKPHTKPVDGQSVDWITPPSIISKLGGFDLDPCFHPKQFYRTASTTISLPNDGLSAKWDGRVWLNPPYGSPIKHWMKKMAEHGDGIALVPARTEVQSWFWPYIWDAAHAVLFLRGRLSYHKPDGTIKGNAGHGSVLAAYGNDNADVLQSSGIDGMFFRLRMAKSA